MESMRFFISSWILFYFREHDFMDDVTIPPPNNQE